MAETQRVAVVQATPVLFDREATVDKACRLVAAAAGEGARFVLLPEAFVPAYPRGLGFGTRVGARSDAGRELFRRYHDACVEVPGPATEALGEAAREHGVWLAVGVVERAGSTLYCTLLYFCPDGALAGTHRKLKPTGSERLLWGEGDGSTLTVVDTGADGLGRVGGLICWENYMPLARMAIYAKGVDVYLAPTADARDTWQATLRHIACEGRCFVLGCNQVVRRGDYPAELRDELPEAPEVVCRGGSVVVSPLGQVLAGPLWEKEGILTADLDLADIARARMDFDVTGHYARPDVFQLLVDERPRASVVVASPGAGTEPTSGTPAGGLT